MQIQIQTRKGSLSDAHKEKIAEKVGKLERFIDRVSSIDVMIEIEKEDAVTVEVSLVTDYKKDFRADYASGDLYGCADQAVAKLEQQIKKFKEKQTDKHAG